MSRFVLTAQLQLQAPRNVSQVVGQIQRQLSGVNVDLNIQNGRQATRQLAQVNQQVKNLNKGSKNLSKNFAVSIKRFAAFSIANRAVSLFTNKLSAATEESIQFQRELIKIKQVSGASDQALSNLTKTITELSVGLGASSKDLLNVSRILAQTGLQAAQLEVALAALAKTTLAPTFESIEKTAEGAVAVLAQFGKGVGALEGQLGSINAVAGQFAVESGDLISAVRRTGGVFKAAGGDLNELLALFTSVRATTRESAESIATGLRTIFTRIQRPKTIEFLKEYGVKLTDLEGKFVGPFEAVRRLSGALQGLEQGDIRFIKIAEQLGGFRQIGKVIPLLQKFEIAERARQAAIKGAGSLDKDAALAQLALSVQIDKTRQSFLDLIRSISETSSFHVMVKTVLGLAEALIKVADALKPIIPLMGAFAAFKIAKGIGGIAGGLRGATTKNAGGPIGLAAGGVVPGTGNRDTVPAMLTPGEFVIRKSSVSKLGAGTLTQMNNNKYAKGGTIANKFYTKDLQRRVVRDADNVKGTLSNKKIQFHDGDEFKSHVIEREYPSKIPKGFVNQGKRVSPKDFEKVVAFKNKGRKRGDTVTGLAESDTAPLDFVLGRKKIEIKRTLEKTSDNVIRDKTVRALMQGQIKGASSRKLTGKKDDQIAIPNVELASDSQGEIPKKLADRMQLRRRKGIKNSFFGGAIQKFALGGIATAKRVGFGILDPDRKQGEASVPITRAQVRSVVGEKYKGNASQRKALDKEMTFPSKNYKLTRQGLNKKTSDNFYNTMSKQAGEAVAIAAKALSGDLGLGSITVPQSVKERISKVFRSSGGPMGKTFEDVVNVMDNQGQFAPEAPGASFDAPRGITGALKDNFSRLPSSWVDLKTSYTEASVPSMTTKIVNELAQTYARTSTFAKARNEKGKERKVSATEAAATAKRVAKQQARNEKAMIASGYHTRNKGGAAPSDTVPALLTPGEFVINKGAASKIGMSNLNRMNKQGVAGFAAGGVVTSDRYAYGGGGVDPLAMAFLLPTIMETFAGSVEKTDEQISQLETTSFDFGSALSKAISHFTTLGFVIAATGVQITRIPSIIKKQFSMGGIKSLNARKRIFDRNVERGKRFAEERQPGGMLARKNAFAPPTSIRGRGLGGRLGGGSRLARFGAGGISKSLGAISKLAGPVALFGGSLLALNSVLGAGFGFQEKYNNAIKLGNVERAKELAVLKEAPAFISLFGKGAAEAYVNLASWFGGNTLESIEANSEAQALAGKTTREFEGNAKDASKAMASLTAGTTTAAEAFASGDLTKNLQNTLDQGAAELRAAQANYENELNRFARPFRNWVAENFSIGSTDADIAELAGAQKEKDRQAIFDKTSKAIDDLGKVTKIGNRELILGAGDFNESMKRLLAEDSSFKKTISPEKIKQLGEAYKNQTKEILLNLKIAKALNSSLFNLDSKLKGLNATMSDSIARITGDFNEFSSTIKQLEAVTKGAAFEEDAFAKKLEGLGYTLDKFGVDDDVSGRLTQRFEDLNKISSNFGDTLNQIREKNPNEIGSSSLLQDKLSLALIDQVEGAGLKDLFKTEGFFADLDLTDVGTDISETVQKLMEKISKGSVIDIAVIKELEKVLISSGKIAKEINKIEEKIIKTKISGIEAQQKTSEVLEEFGVKTFTISKRLELLSRKLEVGLGEKIAANADELSIAISKASEDLRSNTALLSQSIDPEAQAKFGIAIDKSRAKLQRLTKAAEEKIDIDREALKIAKEKLKLDKEAIDSLLSGNIEDFLRQQEAAAAKRSLLSGNSAAVGNFSPRAIGQALKSIAESGDPSGLKQATGTAVRSGFLSQSMADIYTDNTKEIRDLRTDVERLSGVLEKSAGAELPAQEEELRIANKQQVKTQAEINRIKKDILTSSALTNEVNKKIGEKITSVETALESNTKQIKHWEETIVGLRNEESAQAVIEQTAEGVRPKTLAPDQTHSPMTKLPGILSESEAQRDALHGAGTAMEQREILKKLNEDTPENRRRKKLYGDHTDYGMARGGPVYAAGGMFVPRGTDTVPAMLTAGEFVVNKKAVNTGNNRAVLEAMNGGDSSQGGAYYHKGGQASSTVDTVALKAIATSLSSSFRGFNDTVNKLINFKFEMTIAPTRVDVVINTPQAMNEMTSQTKEHLLTAVVNEISINQLGKLKRNRNA